MQTLPVMTQTMASTTATRIGSKSSSSDFLPTLNSAESRVASRTASSDNTGTSRPATETPSKQEPRQQVEARRETSRRQDVAQSETPQGEEPVVAEEGAAEAAVGEDVAQVAEEAVSPQQEQPVADEDAELPAEVMALAAVVTEEVVTPVPEQAVSEAETFPKEDGIPADFARERAVNVHSEMLASGQRETRQPQVAQATAEQTVATTDAEQEPVLDTQIAERIKAQLLQPASIKAESVQVAATTMQQLKTTGLIQVEEIEGLDTLDSVETTAGKITDPRFASLLNRQDVETVLRQRQTPAQVAANTNGLSANGSEKLAETLMATVEGETAEVDMTTTRPNAVVDGLMQGGGSDTAVPAHAQAHVAHTPAATTTATTPGTFVPGQRSALAVPESHIINQTVEHLSIHARGESSTVTVRLHPEELGELQLRMVMEGDQLKVHLHAQSQQVQDVLERNFPRLRDALQDQGVTVEDFQVSVDSGSAEQQQSFTQHGQNSGRGSVAVTMDTDMMAQVAEVVPGVAIDSSQGISVRI